jgi:antitoxin component YwqK of YwqJK toxin-antitoxin module
MKNLIFIFGLLFIFSCNNNTSSTNNTVASIDIDEYDFETIKGTDIEKALKFDKNGNTLAEGFVKNGIKEGEWVEYNVDKGVVSSITSYINGKLNGYYFEFDNRGYLVTQAGFKNDDLHGKLIKLKYGKPTETTDYKNGKLDGKKITYHRNGKIQEETEYKDGIIDGMKKFYNDKEELIMEYSYKNGKQVGGGKVNKELDNTPR